MLGPNNPPIIPPIAAPGTAPIPPINPPKKPPRAAPSFAPAINPAAPARALSKSSPNIKKSIKKAPMNPPFPLKGAANFCNKPFNPLFAIFLVLCFTVSFAPKLNKPLKGFFKFLKNPFPFFVPSIAMSSVAPVIIFSLPSIFTLFIFNNPSAPFLVVTLLTSAPAKIPRPANNLLINPNGIFANLNNIGANFATSASVFENNALTPVKTPFKKPPNAILPALAANLVMILRVFPIPILIAVTVAPSPTSPAVNTSFNFFIFS